MKPIKYIIANRLIHIKREYSIRDIKSIDNNVGRKGIWVEVTFVI